MSLGGSPWVLTLGLSDRVLAVLLSSAGLALYRPMLGVCSRSKLCLRMILPKPSSSWVVPRRLLPPYSAERCPEDGL